MVALPARPPGWAPTATPMPDPDTLPSPCAHGALGHPPPGPRHISSDARTARLVALYEGLDRAGLAALLAAYAEDAWFKDPFQEVRGRAAIGQVFEHMFDTLALARFEVRQALTEGDQACLTWVFHVARRPGDVPLAIRGASHLVYGPDGRVLVHRDYWDAAEELYAQVPVLGALMRALQRRLRAPLQRG